ncbi:hypothetical protein MMC13_005919 [Lambiella insularis]|nr:hypothetical protein [Lambiella insularis]
MQEAGEKRKITSPEFVSRNEQKRVRRSGDLNPLERPFVAHEPWITGRPTQDTGVADTITRSVVTFQTYSRAVSAPPELHGGELQQECRTAERACKIDHRASMHFSAERDTLWNQQTDNASRFSTNNLLLQVSTTQQGIKQEVDHAPYRSQPREISMVTSVEQGRAQVLAKRIRDLIDKRKEHSRNIDTLRKRIRQSQLTYADLMRKRNRLENSLADLKVTLESDEQLLKTEARSVDHIPAEIEQASAELVALISG